MNETRQIKRSANQENKLIYFLVCGWLYRNQLGCQATIRSLVGTGNSSFISNCHHYFTSPQALERLELS